MTKKITPAVAARLWREAILTGKTIGEVVERWRATRKPVVPA